MTMVTPNGMTKPSSTFEMNQTPPRTDLPGSTLSSRTVLPRSSLNHPSPLTIARLRTILLQNPGVDGFARVECCITGGGRYLYALCHNRGITSTILARYPVTSCNSPRYVWSCQSLANRGLSPNYHRWHHDDAPRHTSLQLLVHDETKQLKHVNPASSPQKAKARNAPSSTEYVHLSVTVLYSPSLSRPLAHSLGTATHTKLGLCFSKSWPAPSPLGSCLPLYAHLRWP
ncbi:hypothetical protein LXA43DRAFT_1031971 [Ganoderma leucocontextum]|nr:hypothetical protein LXA43DRAFT_1031971 [Ganoderma leucocontextum]